MKKNFYVVLLIVLSSLFHISKCNHYEKSLVKHKITTKHNNNISSARYTNIAYRYYNTPTKEVKQISPKPKPNNNLNSLIISSILLSIFLVSITIAILSIIAFKVATVLKCARCGKERYIRLNCCLEGKGTVSLKKTEGKVAPVFTPNSYYKFEEIIRQSNYIDNSNQFSVKIKHACKISSDEFLALQTKNVPCEESDDTIKLAERFVLMDYDRISNALVGTRDLLWKSRHNLLQYVDCDCEGFNSEKPFIVEITTPTPISEFDLINIMLNDLTIITDSSVTDKQIILLKKFTSDGNTISTGVSFSFHNSSVLTKNKYLNEIKKKQSWIFPNSLSLTIDNEIKAIDTRLRPHDKTKSLAVHYRNFQEKYFIDFSSVSEIINTIPEWNEDSLSDLIPNSSKKARYTMDDTHTQNSEFESQSHLENNLEEFNNSVPLDIDGILDYVLETENMWSDINSSIVNDWNLIKTRVERILIYLIENNKFDEIISENLFSNFIFDLMIYHNQFIWEIEINSNYAYLSFYIHFELCDANDAIFSYGYFLYDFELQEFKIAKKDFLNVNNLTCLTSLDELQVQANSFIKYAENLLSV